MSAPELPARNERQFASLLSEISRARASVREARGSPPSYLTRQEKERSCERLVEALEAYANAVAIARLPLPYKFRDEIRLYRALYPGIPRHPGPAG
jgi:hypothetical protein